MLDTIEGRFAKPIFAADAAPLMGDLRGHLESIPAHPSDPLADLGFKLLSTGFTQMVQQSRQVVGAMLYTSEKHKRDITELRKRLAIAIPPNEYDDTTEPATFAGILNASWDFYLTEPNLLPGSHLATAEGKDRFYDLVSWALEAAELSESWRQSHHGL